MLERLERPLVSVVVCTKEGMPYIREAMASLECQTYRHFEVVVQDATSTDGTREFLEHLPFERLDVVSEPDGGIGDAFNRAFARCSGALVTSLDADNLLEPDALEKAVAVHREHPRAAASYGAALMVNADGTETRSFVPRPFDLDALMRCELVPPFSTSFFSRRICGAELRCESFLTTCADFDLWLRLSAGEIVHTTRVLGRTRLSAKSMTLDPSRYEQFCRDKLAALERHFGRRPDLIAERSESIAGVYCWAAESLLALEGVSERCTTMLERASAAAPGYERVRRVASALQINGIRTPAATTPT
jgi:glycosyltransferase involved in cell wall biosynthesis